MIITEFQNHRKNFAQSRLVERPVSALKDGDIRVRVDRFALTANNITYAVVGERIGYWKFFPVDDPEWGLVPVWGFAEVEASNCPTLPVGERLYGYWPMATSLVMTPGKISDNSFFDHAVHRQELPPVYNRYLRVKADAGYDRSFDNDRMILYPLYATSFCIYDFLKDNDYFDAERIIVLSASSKTAIGVGYALSADEKTPASLGITSTQNFAKTKAIGAYDELTIYDDIEKLNANERCVIIDMSGNGPVLGQLHAHFRDNMKYTSNVGITHYDDYEGASANIIRERSAMFFAPGHIQKRTQDWGPGEFERRAHAFWSDAAHKSRNWLHVKEASGIKAIQSAWDETRKGDVGADAAWVVTL